MLEKLILINNERRNKISAKRLRRILWASGFLLLMVGAFSLVAHIAISSEYVDVEQITEDLNWLDDAGHCNYEKVDLKNIIEGIVRALDFVENNLNELILDSVAGTRILEAQLNLFQLGHSNLPPSFQALLAKIKLRCKNLSDAIINNLISSEMQAKERQQLVQNLHWINDTSKWEIPSIRNWQLENEADLIFHSNRTFETIKIEKYLIGGENSDKCIHDINQDCNVSTKCAELFLEKMFSHYSLTHQIFFFLFAKKKNCFSDKNFRLKMGETLPEEFMHRMCNKVWEEANAFEQSGFPSVVRDLLAEQIAVCSLVGYTKFLKLSWLKAILSWQSESGCYYHDGKPLTRKNSNQNSRVKRSDKLIEMGAEKCSAHFTSVALAAMAMHLRYLGDTCLVN